MSILAERESISPSQAPTQRRNQAAQTNADTVEIAVDTNGNTVNISAAALEALAQSDVETLVITSELGVLALSSEIAATVADQGDDITISQTVGDAVSLTQAQQDVLGDNAPARISITSDDTAITQFQDTAVTITLPYILHEGERAENLVVWFVDDTGFITPVEAQNEIIATIAAVAIKLLPLLFAKM